MQPAVTSEKRPTTPVPLVRQSMTNDLADVVSLAYQTIRNTDEGSIDTIIPTASLRLIISTFLALASGKQMERPWVQNYEKELKSIKISVVEENAI
jgi:hypothetical protein